MNLAQVIALEANIGLTYWTFKFIAGLHFYEGNTNLPFATWASNIDIYIFHGAPPLGGGKKIKTLNFITQQRCIGNNK